MKPPYKIGNEPLLHVIFNDVLLYIYLQFAWSIINHVAHLSQSKKIIGMNLFENMDSFGKWSEKIDSQMILLHLIIIFLINWIVHIL